MKNRLLKYIILYFCAANSAFSLHAQVFSFSCARDTTVNGCGASSCFTLQHIIPDIHGNTGAYTINPIVSNSNSCFPAYIAPNGTGTSAGFIQDDTYTAPINIGFSFPFYGAVYNRLVASTNGYICFDNAFGAGYFSHFAMLNDGAGGLSPYSGVPENLPSALYDRAVIMGPYHDLHPGLTTSPTQRIQYSIVGTAPHRKWILSYYKVPLYTQTAGLCDVRIENTHQIVLYESTGIVEVLIFDMQQCPNWNEGRAMVGMQNFNRDQGIMAPGRSASDAPWGNPGMNEAWRFVPSAGPSLFKRVELFDLAGALVSTGTITNLNNGKLRVDFPNVCGPAGTTTYVARSVYTKIDNAAAEIFATDTIRVTKNNSGGLNATTATTAATCGQPNGTVTINVPAGNGVAPYQYSLNGGPLQSSNNFTNLAAGPYTGFVQDAGGCNSTINITVAQTSSLSITTTTTPATCSGNNNGSITVTPTSGTGPYTFVLNGTTTLTGSGSVTFSNVVPGTHTVIVNSSAGCASGPTTVVVGAGATLTATVSNTNITCNGTSTGAITISNVSGGTAPYQYSLDGVIWQTSNIFNGLTAGAYAVSYRDANGCQASQNNIVITQPAILSLTSSVIQPTCTQANGSIVITGAGGVAPYQYSLNGTSWQSGNTFNGLSAGSYQPGIRDNNGCIQSLPAVVITEINSIQAAATVINATCLNVNGNITINATGGSLPYRYSLNNENWQTSNSFNVVPGIYSGYVLDNAGCAVTINGITVGMNNILTLSMPASVSICEGSSAQLAVTSIASQFSWSPAIGLSNSSIANPVANPATSTQYTVIATLGTCQLTGTVNLIVNPAPVANAGADIIMCEGQTKQLQGSGGTRYTWAPSTFMNGTGANPAISPDRDITYTLSVIDANNCSSLKKDTVRVIVKPPLKVLASPSDTVVHAGAKFKLLATAPEASFVWSPSVGLDNPFIANPELTVSTDNVYKVTATTPEGCKAEGFVKIRVYKGPDMYIPTGFTPNGDGRNDTFAPFTVGIKEIKYFRVFNRSGQLIFSTNRIGDAWDGRFKGAQQPNDVYVWMAEGITGNNEVITKKGTIMLIR